MKLDVSLWQTWDYPWKNNPDLDTGVVGVIFPFKKLGDPSFNERQHVRIYPVLKNINLKVGDAVAVVTDRGIKVGIVYLMGVLDREFLLKVPIEKPVIAKVNLGHLIKKLRSDKKWPVKKRE